MQNAGLDEAQVGIKIVKRNINNLRYTDDTTLMAERGEELKSILMKVKEESGKSWLKTQHSPRGMVQGGRREWGWGWGTHVYLWRIYVDIWQNQYNIVKLKNKIK